MILLYLLLFLASFALYYWGGLNPYLGYALMLASALACLYYLFKYLLFRFRLRLFRRRNKLSFVLPAEHSYGLPLFRGQLLYLYTREEKLFMESQGWVKEIAFSDIEKISIFPLKQALSKRDSAPEDLALGPIAAWHFKGALQDLPLQRGRQFIVLELWPEGEKDEAVFLLSEANEKTLRKLFKGRKIEGKLQFN